MGFPEPAPNPASLYAYAHQIDDMTRGLRAYHRSIIDTRTGQVIRRPPAVAVQLLHNRAEEWCDMTAEMLALCYQG